MKLLKKKFDAWKADRLSKMKTRKDQFLTDSGIEFQDLAIPAEDSEERYISNIGFPGEFPFTRGPHASMYRGCLLYTSDAADE